MPRRRRFALGQALEQGLELVDVLGRDQVEQGHALDVLEGLVAEHLQVGLVGADVHALVDVGDRLARGIDQRVAAALGLAHLRFQRALRAARVEVVPFGADVLQELLGPAAQGHGLRALRLHAVQDFVGHPVQHRQQRHVAAAAHHHHRHFVERHQGGGVFGQHHVDRLLGQLAGQFVQRFRAQRAHRDAGIAQAADDGLGLVDLVVDQDQSQCGVLTDGHA